MKTKELKEEIEKLKKKYWKLYTPLINANFEAFELSRKIGVLQGKYQATQDFIKLIDETHINWDTIKSNTKLSKKEVIQGAWLITIFKEELKQNLKEFENAQP